MADESHTPMLSSAAPELLLACQAIVHAATLGDPAAGGVAATLAAAAIAKAACGDVPDPEDSIDYEGLKASVGRLTRQAYDVNRRAFHAEVPRRCQDDIRHLAGYLRDVCGFHDIEIPEES